MDSPVLDQRTRSAQAELAEAFAKADLMAAEAPGPVIGIFGNGAPETLIAACGATPVHVNFGKAETHRDIDTLIERFVDHEVRIFLNRFAAGAFNAFAGIVFVRDDAPALTAYQYATEWVRQGRGAEGAPPLFLFNLVHASTPAVEIFNAVQGEKLLAFLTGLGLTPPDAAALVRHAETAARRRALTANVSPIQRNAGRFLSADRHADLLEAALAEKPSVDPAVRLGLVGSPLSSARAYDLFATFGDIVSDLQPFGQVWPGPWEAEPDLGRTLKAIAADPFCPRIAPPSLHREALVADLVAVRCDLVLCQLAQTDDTFGWEIPALSKALAEHGIGFVNLGFRDAEPSAEWLDRAAVLIAQAVEARP